MLRNDETASEQMTDTEGLSKAAETSGATIGSDADVLHKADVVCWTCNRDQHWVKFQRTYGLLSSQPAMKASRRCPLQSVHVPVFPISQSEVVKSVRSDRKSPSSTVWKYDEMYNREVKTNN